MKSELRVATGDSAVALILLTGAAVLLTTPVPHGQSYLFYCVPWGAFLAARCLSDIDFDLLRLRQQYPALIFSLVVCSAAMKFMVAALSVAVWGVILLFAAPKISAASRSLRPGLSAALVLTLGSLVYSARAADGLWKHEGIAQSRIICLANQRIPRGDSVLETWPLVTPFRPQPSYHGFARRGPVQTIGVRLLEDEYIAAMAGGRVRWVVVDDQDVRRQLPRMAGYLEANCVPVTEPLTRDRLRLYDCSKR